MNPILTSPVYFLGMNFNTILLSMFRSSKQFLSFRVSLQNHLKSSRLSHTWQTLQNIPPPLIWSIYEYWYWWIVDLQIILLFIMQFPPAYYYVFFLSPHIYLTSLFSNTLTLYSYINVTNQISKSYNRTGKVTAVYILIFKFRHQKVKKKKLNPMPVNIPEIKSAH